MSFPWSVPIVGALAGQACALTGEQPRPPGSWSWSARATPPFQNPLPSRPYLRQERDPSPISTMEIDIPPPPHEALAGQAAVQQAEHLPTAHCVLCLLNMLNARAIVILAVPNGPPPMLPPDWEMLSPRFAWWKSRGARLVMQVQRQRPPGPSLRAYHLIMSPLLLSHNSTRKTGKTTHYVLVDHVS